MNTRSRGALVLVALIGVGVDYTVQELIPGSYRLSVYDVATGTTFPGLEVTITPGRVHELNLTLPAK